MQAERDHLVRFVFPRLREALIRRRIHLVDVDLRWGVTEEQDALSVCREVLDECQLFLCMLGGRYGWTPPGCDRSITHDEIFRAALEPVSDPVHTTRLFYFRDLNATEQMAESTPGEIREPRRSQEAEKLDRLKQEITDRGYRPFVYGEWNGQRLTGLDAFGKQVEVDLLAAVDSLGVTTAVIVGDEFAEQSAAMDAFIDQRSNQYVAGARQGILDELNHFAAANTTDECLFLAGDPGSGKSAALANFIRHYGGVNSIVTSHFAGAGVGSTSLSGMLRRFCHALGVASISRDINELVAQFQNALERAANSQRVILIVDALNEMDAISQAWLPPNLPPSVRVIVSSLEHPNLDAFRQQVASIRKLTLPPLETTDAKAIVEHVLSRFHKRLSREQIKLLLAKEDAGRPLYLLAAIEELRTLGTFEQISARIRELPGSIQGLFEWILSVRLSRDSGFRNENDQNGAQLVKAFTALLATSRHGLSSEELCELINPGDPNGNIAALERLLRPYLMYRGELLDFYHGQFREAAKQMYLATESEKRATHHRLARYFTERLYDDDRALAELPHHLIKGNDRETLRSILSDHHFIQAKCRAKMVYQLIDDYEHAIEHSVELAGLRPIGDALKRSSHVLESDPAQVGAQLLGRIDSEGEQCLLCERLRSEPGPRLTPLHPTLTGSGSALVRTLMGHSQRVEALAVTPDGAGVLSSGLGGAVLHWDLKSGRLIRTVITLPQWVHGLAFSADGRRFAAAFGGTVGVYDFEHGSELHSFCPDDGVIRAIAVNDDGLLSGMTKKSVYVWTLDGEHVRQLNSKSAMIPPRVFSFDGRFAVFAGYRELIVYDLRQGSVVSQLNKVFQNSAIVAYTRNSRLIASHPHRTLALWDHSTETALPDLKGHQEEITAVTVSPDERYCISGGDRGELKLWDLKDCKEIGRLERHTSEITALSVTPDNRYALSATDDGSIRVWDLQQAVNLAPQETEWGWMNDVAFFPDCSRAVSVDVECRLMIWDVDSGKRLHTYCKKERLAGSIECVAVSHDGRYAICGDADGALSLWDLRQGVRQAYRTEHENSIDAVDVCPFDQFAVSASYDGTLCIWDLHSTDVIKLEGHTDAVSAVQFLPNGRQIVSASHDGTLRVWDIQTRQVVNELDGYNGLTLAVGENGRVLVLSFSENTIRGWDLETDQIRFEISGPLARADRVFASDRIAGSVDGPHIRIWDLKSGQFLAGFTGETPIRNCAIGPDNRTIATCDDASNVHFFKWVN